MKTIFFLVAMSLTLHADEFAIRGSWFKGNIEQISRDGTKVYVTDAAQSYKGWWEPAADLDAATRDRLGFTTTPEEQAMLAKKHAQEAQERAEAARLKVQQQIAFERLSAQYQAEELAKLNRPDPRKIAEQERIQRAKEFYARDLDRQAVQAFQSLVEVQQLELLRKLGYLK